MHLHRYEKWWITFGIGSLVLFLIIVGIGAFHQGHQPPSSVKTINYEQVDKVTPFNEPGLTKVSGKDWDYELVVVASAFMYMPAEVEIPVGSTVKIIATTKDVVHGYGVTGTNINMMLEPGYISEYVTTMDKIGEYLVVCNEYCGTGHHTMKMMYKVVDVNE
ncbi:cytochrome B5 [Domibacillus mangrovi]|uniref:Cytochrome aa3 subunit 2 n=1 Tax=Domibacillus mangrovi TaxID=1714354 RepID=A0A1Q5P782_9BACI|nr:cytochrome B5 [Domibacillus mangrovi]OKL37952.1 cytochrome B5 [Domibacillus mangrovi]